MPATKRAKPLYRRGKYELHRREGRRALQIIWYDAERKRERSASAGTDDLQAGMKALDRLYLSDAGERVCPTCQRPWDHAHSPLVSEAIGDYLIEREGRAGHESARYRLSHVVEYLKTAGAGTRCAQIDELWIDRFRKWALARPVTARDGSIIRPRSLAHVEGSVLQLAAAINSIPGQRALFKARPQISVARSPVYRADIDTLAAMFAYCLLPEARTDKEAEQRRKERVNLLAYLRLSVASWARPETVCMVEVGQWHSAPRVLDLNPVRRERTNKRLPMVPMPRQIVPYLDAMTGPWIPVSSIRGAWDKMRDALGLPDNREAGPKLIRRSVSTLARRIIGEANWAQGQMMLGHSAFSISDIYAIPDPANLGLALTATESIIEQIEAKCPGSYRTFTALDGGKVLARGLENG